MLLTYNREYNVICVCWERRQKMIENIIDRLYHVHALRLQQNLDPKQEFFHFICIRSSRTTDWNWAPMYELMGRHVECR